VKQYACLMSDSKEHILDPSNCCHLSIIILVSVLLIFCTIATNQLSVMQLLLKCKPFTDDHIRSKTINRRRKTFQLFPEYHLGHRQHWNKGLKLQYQQQGANSQIITIWNVLNTF